MTKIKVIKIEKGCGNEGEGKRIKLRWCWTILKKWKWDIIVIKIKESTRIFSKNLVWLFCSL